MIGRPAARMDTSGLAAMLSSQRWFGAKTSAIRDVTVRDVIPLAWPSVDAAAAYAVARADVTTEEGMATYQVFFRRGDEQWRDALGDSAFRGIITRAFEQGAVFESERCRWIVEREDGTLFTLGPHSAVTQVGAQQSNSSLIIDDRAILKLFRRLQPGIQPDLEVTRFLSVERDFEHVPALLGSIRFEDARGTTTAGLLQEFVPGAQDVWGIALEAARAHVAASAPGDSPFAAAADRIGAVTRVLHETLASGDPGTPFESRAADARDVRAWAALARETMAGTLQALRRALSSGVVPSELRADAQAIAGSADRWTRWIDETADQIGADAGIVARVHGDYHLGQVLRARDGRFLVIDFEGEPTRSIEERRAPQSPLRDVAGMLRSFDYAAAAAGGGSSAATPLEWEWRDRCRAAFVNGYTTSALQHETTTIRWKAPMSMARILALFECEKLFYELRYELGHRLDWLWIPLRALTAFPT